MLNPAQYKTPPEEAHRWNMETETQRNHPCGTRSQPSIYSTALWSKEGLQLNPHPSGNSSTEQVNSMPQSFHPEGGGQSESAYRNTRTKRSTGIQSV